MKHKANALLGPYTRARSRQEEHHVQGVVQAGHPQPQLKMSSQTRLYSPQKREIVPGPSKWPGCRGQTGTIPQRGEDGGGPTPLSHPLSPPLGNAAASCKVGLGKGEGHRLPPCPACPHGGWSSPNPGSGTDKVSLQLPSSDPPCTTPIDSSFLGHAISPIPPRNQSILPATLWATRPSRFKGSSADLDRSS